MFICGCGLEFFVHNKINSYPRFSILEHGIIGASLSKPHTNQYYEKIAVLMYVCMYVCTCMYCAQLMTIAIAT